MTELRRKTIVLDGVRISYLEKESSARAVILLHGFASGSYIWKHFPEKIMEPFRILIPDLPGHGSSGLPGSEPTLEYHVRLIEQFRLAAGISQFTGVGHSMGAAILASYSVTHPGKLNGLILESPPDGIGRLPFLWRIMAINKIGDFLMNFYPPTRGILERRLNSGVSESGLFTEEMVDDAWNAFSKGTIKKWIPRALRVSGLTVAWEKVPLHCKIAYGIQDRLVRPAFLNRLRRVLPSSEFHGFENCRHVPHLEYPEKFAGLLVGI
jgi:pimeloyl-ACP methyl ester carboxylesterase